MPLADSGSRKNQGQDPDPLYINYQNFLNFFPAINLFSHFPFFDLFGEICEYSNFGYSSNDKTNSTLILFFTKLQKSSPIFLSIPTQIIVTK